MLNFTTTTIVNSGNSIFADATNKLFRIKYGPELYNDGSIHKAVLVKKQAYVAATPAVAKVALPTNSADNAGIYRIAMYIRLRNNNNPYFYNNWTFKGRPLYIEFTLGATNATGDTIDTIVARAKNMMLAQYGYDLVKFGKQDATNAVYYADAAEYNAAKGTSLDATAFAALTDAEKTKVAATPDMLTITAVDQWEIFMDQDANSGVKLEVLKTVDTAGNVVTGSTSLPTHEEFVASDQGTVTVDNGNEAFGDFAHIVKDLRLPTDANRRWQGIAEGDVFGGEPNDDKPMPNGQYTQYTIQYTSERGVLQQTALGGVATSRTVHVFYVESAATSAFETALTTSTIGTSEGTADLI